jgi:hypothetical protein
MVMPPWQCEGAGSPGGNEGADIFGMLAASQQMRTNSYRAGRSTGVQLKFHCGESIAAFLHRPLSPTSVYVVTPQIATVISAGSAKCHNLDGYILCSKQDDFGLGATHWEPQTTFWIRSHYKTILMRDPTDQELAKWNRTLDQSPQSRADFFVDLLTSPEFERRSIPRFWAYLDTKGRWPTRAEWVENDAAQPLAGAGSPEHLHAPRDRNRAIVYMLYFALLGRDPDIYGLASWPDSLAHLPLKQVVLLLLDSQEYKIHEYLH